VDRVAGERQPFAPVVPTPAPAATGVYYDVAGQSFSPFGQSYDEAFWNLESTFDPAAISWRDLEIPGLGILPCVPDVPGLNNGNLAGLPLLDQAPLDGLPQAGGSPLDPGFGFRGSTFSTMLPLEPDAAGNYTKACSSPPAAPRTVAPSPARHSERT
jgi:hypothetical protein